MNVILSASIIAADYNQLGTEIQAIAHAGIDMIHFDVMDHHYVPNLSIGPSVCASLAKHSPLPIEAHLMVTNPDSYIQAFAQAGASMLTIHPSTCPDPAITLQAIRDAGMKAGLAFNPDESPMQHEALLHDIDTILLMSVFPGFCGQSFINTTYDKISNMRQWLNQHNNKAYLAVDGGIKTHNIQSCAQVGADFFVMGSGIFGQDNYQNTVQNIRKKLAEA